ncbi:hypothetical protein TNCV_3626271 [Trichonephila clavipes]|nr:hypothetical protein TNCV_3626271 [Trichonephila clavipes]
MEAIPATNSRPLLFGYTEHLEGRRSKIENRTIATPPGFHRPTNRHHATQQNGKHHICHAQHHRLSRYGIEDCFTVQTPKRKRLFNAHDENERILEKAWLVSPR